MALVNWDSPPANMGQIL